MGADCHQTAARAVEFQAAQLAVRNCMDKIANKAAAPDTRHQTSLEQAEAFWTSFKYLDQVLQDPSKNKAQREHASAAVATALAQMFGPDSFPMRQGLIKYLTGVQHAEATRALARLALFSAEANLRDAALTALRVRREKDYTDILVKALRYPWPEVARRAASAVIQIERTDLIPDLVALLDEPDPRLPQLKKYDGKEVYLAQQLVRINHHRNCVLCHAPAQSGPLSPQIVTAPVPLPSEKLLPFAHYYAHSMPQLSVRVDVTYLRQDFSLLQNVPDAQPWPELQRFDYLVRTVLLTKQQAKTYETKMLIALAQLAKQQAATYDAKLVATFASGHSPYQEAALGALRALTGLDAGPTAAAWRKALKLPG
jgi:hypothetical protein